MSKAGKSIITKPDSYAGLMDGISGLLESARRTSARAVNAVMTATYWEIGHRIVEFEQGGKTRADYGKEVLQKLSADLTSRFGRGFGVIQLRGMRQFFSAYPEIRQSAIDGSSALPGPIRQSPIDESDPAPPAILQSPIEESTSTPSDILQSPIVESHASLRALANRFPLTWTHYTRLLRVRKTTAREFYETEALRGGWSVRQLERQIGSQFYERTALSRNKASMLAKGAKPQPGDLLAADEEIRDPLVLEFLNLKDEYSESDLEDALIRHLEHFLLELGGAFTFVARQRRLRIDHEWFRVDLLFFHRRLRSLVVIDLKTGPLRHADVGQMHLYLNYAREHWCEPGENPPVGLILCTEKGESLARYALDGLPNPMLVREYLTTLPDEARLAAEITAARLKLEARTTRR
ncbi:MAG: PDDEXK nuclease domain-containing protein [Verrucomicrobiota bacterium]